MALSAIHCLAIRPVAPADRTAWLELRTALWPDGAEDHEGEIAAFFAGLAAEPQAVFVAEEGGRLIGFVEMSLRSFADGFSSSPVGYLEGWYVSPEVRRRGVGRRLVAAGEDWARGQGCAEFASETELENEASAAAHAALGFEEVAAVSLFRKKLGVVPRARLAGVHPVLATRDVAASIQFYLLLGFTLSFQDSPTSPTYAAVCRGGVELHLQWAGEDQWAYPTDRPALRFLVDDVDALYRELVASGAVNPLSSDGSPWAAPGDTPWGTREFHLRDPGRNSLQFYRARKG